MSAPVVCENLTKRFGRVSAVDGLNLEVPQGSIYALIGPNGAGKTTLIKMLMNLIQPGSGRAVVLGTGSVRLEAADLTRIGYVSENQVLSEWMTVGYFLRYLKPFYPEWDDALASELVHEFELPLDRKLRALSRGMKVKAALTAALAYRPKLIVLDEPFSGLDPLVRDEFVQGLLERAAEATVFISSHDLAEVESFASHVGFLDRGRMQLSEEITDLTARFRTIEVTMDGSPALPGQWPVTWIGQESAAPLVRFVETRFDETGTPGRISELFAGARNVSITRMSLREIFIALAKSRRKAA